ncbi:hypothetical protein V5799_020239 [Amblyomma americanum]|uniref:Uncharacterized protein n=1 Tax=Amblyomma americanum TaxID=6943 RepID=A0AAQ4EUM3_AMBAM
MYDQLKHQLISELPNRGRLLSGMKSVLLCLCIAAAVIMASGSDNKKRGRPRRIRLPSKIPRQPYCPKTCHPFARVGIHCGPDCLCVAAAPGMPPSPLPCIWSPASEHSRYQRAKRP